MSKLLPTIHFINKICFSSLNKHTQKKVLTTPKLARILTLTPLTQLLVTTQSLSKKRHLTECFDLFQILLNTLYQALRDYSL